MAGSSQRGTSFSLNVTLATKPKLTIKPQQREKIFEYLKSHLHLYQKHLLYEEEIDFFKVSVITKESETLKIQICVSDEKCLEKVFSYSKQPAKDFQNGLSFSLTSFFFNQSMQTECGFHFNTKVIISAIMSEKERKKVTASFEKNQSQPAHHGVKKEKTQGKSDISAVGWVTFPEPDTTAAIPEYSSVPLIWNTFIIDVPEDKEVISIRIRSRSMEELNQEMNRESRNLYSVDIQLAAEFDSRTLYWYELTFKDSVLYFFKQTSKVDSTAFVLGDKTVHRDILWEETGVLFHSLDIVHFKSDKYSESDLIMQLEDVCKHIRYSYEKERIIKALLKSGIDHSARYLSRFAFMLGTLCKNNSNLVYSTISENLAHEILDVLLQKRLTNFPNSCSHYMPDLCRLLFKRAYGNDFCWLIFLTRASPFLSDDMLLSALRTFISHKEKVASNHPDCEQYASNLCLSFYNEFIRTGTSTVRDIFEYLFRHLPLEMTIPSYEMILRDTDAWGDDTDVIGRKEDALTAISASIKSQVLSFSNRMLKEKTIIPLLDMATYLGKLEVSRDKNIRKTFEDNVVILFSSHSLNENDIKDCVVRFLEKSYCFVELETQILLLRAIAESKNPEVRKLFLLLNKDHILTEAFDCIEVNVYKTWLQNEIRSAHTPHNVLLSTFTALFEMLKLPVVGRRVEIREALENVASDKCKAYTLKEMLQQIDRLDKLCEEEPLISSLYKKQVQDLLMKKGLTPCEVLKFFCTNGSIRVNTRTTCDIVCTITDLFFKKDSKDKDIYQDFFTQIQHVEFWELIRSGGGSLIHDVKKNETFKQVMSCINKVTFLVRNNETDISFIRKINISDDKTRRMLVLGGMDMEGISSLNLTFKKMIKYVEGTVVVVLNVLEEIHERNTSAMWPDVTKVIESVQDIRKKCDEGKLFVKEAMSQSWLWGDMSELPELCKKLEPVIKSNVFWNTAEETILTHELSIHSGTPLQALTSIRYLFGCNTNESDILEILNKEQITLFLIRLKTDGLHTFVQRWTSLEKDKDMTMHSVLAMFEKSNVPDEIKIANTVLSQSPKANVLTTLTQLWRRNELIEKTQAMTSVLEAFELNLTTENELLSAMESFKNLVRQNISENTFRDVQVALRAITSITDKLADETISIMAEIGNNSLLVEFLKEIAIEDVRNLIDAVEDISESLVQESTVSSLIEVKRFLFPLLTGDLKEDDCESFFQILERQTRSYGKNAGVIPEKIRDCSLNLHNLKSLYNNVANRGQQTKEVIKCIITKGKFTFSLNSDLEEVFYEVSYKDNKNRFTKQEATLSDIRSRALLLLNSDRHSTESGFNQHEFSKFIVSVDLCFEIRGILYDLFSLGHIRYKSFKVPLPIDELHAYKDNLKKDLEKWMNCMTSARNKYYLVNFIQGHQIRLISNFLDNGTSVNQVDAVLKYIHPKLTSEKLVVTYRKDDCLFDEDLVLEELGRALHEMFTHLSLYYTVMTCDGFTPKLTECVAKGKLLVAVLEENSVFVIRTVFALYRNTVQRFPEPNQLLLCTKQTSWNEIDLLLKRCKGAQIFYGKSPLYCIANVELLQNEVQFKLVEQLQDLRHHKDILLAIICRGSKNHPFIDELNDSLVAVQPVSDHVIKSLLHEKCPYVSTYTSEVAGLGKTASVCMQSVSYDRSLVTLHISGQLRKDMIIAKLNELKVREFHTLHLDIGAVDEPMELDLLLFELIVLKFVSAGSLAFYTPTEHISVEIANTISNNLRNSLATVTSFKREHLIWNDFSDFICSEEINSPTQVVCNYLSKLDRGVLDSEELCFSGKNKTNAMSALECRKLLKIYINMTTDLSFSVVHTFLNVLSNQLKKFSISAFFKVAHLSEMIGKSTVMTVRSNLVRAMIDVSMEFAARSINVCRSTQNLTLAGDENTQATQKQTDDLDVEIINRVDGMIRWEESNHLIYVFHSLNVSTLSPMYRNREKVPLHVRQLFESQMNRVLQDFTLLKQTDLQNILQRVARKNPTPLTETELQNLSRDYALTPDNLLKMILIMMRCQSKVPVLIMGETGCGKTSLIRYLARICDVPFTVINIHAGVSSSDVVATVMQENARCCERIALERWLFFDEINTSENIGLICDVICHNRCNGRSLAPNLTVMGACNPYKLRTFEEIHTAGLTGKIKTDELSKLVYRVLPLPEMMVDFVWDFGSLSESDENKYIRRMVENVFHDGSKEHSLFSDLLSVSQSFVRKTEASSGHVSLRDVQRCITLVSWFLSILEIKPLKKSHTKQMQLQIEVKAIVLSLAHCYHSRFLHKYVRREYRHILVEGFRRNEYFCFKDEGNIHDIIKEEQKDILDRMDLPSGTAKNTALQENVFVILVCILNRIPIFVVGKPGCSKSLAMQVIRSNLRGKDSKDAFFKTLPQLYCVSFQGSESSTSDGIIKVFEKGQNYQNSNSKDSVLSVVLLDEIGLAEISRFNPLKVLHNLLEPEGNSRPDIAVVGISNWALDASKMNRAIHLSRPEMDKEELYETAMSIALSFTDSIETQEGFTWNEAKTNPVSTETIRNDLKRIAESYLTYTTTLQFKNFHGLRDFYSLVKFIARRLAKDPKGLSSRKKSAIIQEGLFRNFGGLKTGRHTLICEFKECLIGSELLPLTNIDLIKSNLVDTVARHLMIITKGESVLGILEHCFRDSGRKRHEVIFGSQFTEDLTDDYNYRILSRIILCMEQGMVLVLKNLENIYGSLYDMLNQNYTRIGNKNNCRVALGPYSNPFCHVADSFRCIVLVDENKVDYTDPPFLNRFEKQYLTFADSMHDKESKTVNELDNWLDNLTHIHGKQFSKYNALPFYTEELIVSLVLNISRNSTKSDSTLLEDCQKELLWIVRPEVVVRLSHVEDTAIQQSSDLIRKQYFQMPLHDGLGKLIQHQISSGKDAGLKHMTVVFTNSNIHTKLKKELSSWNFQSEKLGAFKSEKQLSVRLEQFWNSSDIQILLVHCNAQDDDKHIMLAKTLIENYGMEYDDKHKEQNFKFVYLVVHLGFRDILQENGESQHSLTQINYLSGWKIIFLDNLESVKTTLPDLCSKSLKDTIERMLPLSYFIKEELFWAFTRIQYDKHGRSLESINCVIEKMQHSDTLLQILSEILWLKIQDGLSSETDTIWYVKVACDTQALNTSASLTAALERYIRGVLVNPLAKTVFKLEHLGALDSFFVEDAKSKQRRELWCKNIRNDSIFTLTINGKPIKDVSGPECYHCDTPDLGLKLPFSRIVFDYIEDTKVLFTEEVARSKLKCGLEPDDELPEEVMNEIILQQESFILKQLSEILECTDLYVALLTDYVSDFSNMFSFTFTSVLDRDTRTEYMQWLLKQKVSLRGTDNVQVFTQIHSAGWTHQSLFGSSMCLLELCADKFKGGTSNIILEFENAMCYKSFHVVEEHAGSSNNELKIKDDGECITEYENDLHDEERGTIKLHDGCMELPMSDASPTSHSNVPTEAKRSIVSVTCESVTRICTEEDGFKMNNDSQHECLREHVILDISDKDMIASDKTDKQLYSESVFNLEQEQSIDIAAYNQASEGAKDENASPTVDELGTDGLSTHQSDDEENMTGDRIENLVSFVCLKMIPTVENFIRFADIHSWHISVRNILVLAAEVSSSSEHLHALRLCNDIVTDLIIPYDLSSALVQDLGSCLALENIGSEPVFSALVSVFKHVKGPESSVHIQSILSQYLIRCLSSDVDTTAYIHFFKAIKDEIIPEKHLQLLKQPLDFIFQQQLEENGNVFRNVLADDIDMVDNENCFVFSLHQCLCSLVQRGLSDCAFIQLIVDILQKTFETDDEIDNNYDLMLDCGQIIQKKTPGLPLIAAIAYLKAAISFMTYAITNEDVDGISCLLSDFSGVMCGLMEMSVYKSLLVYFLKGLGKNSAICTVIKRCRKLSDKYIFTRNIEWVDGYLPKTLEGNVLMLHVPNEILTTGETYIQANQTTEEFSTNVKHLVDFAFKTPVDGLVLLFSSVMKEYYLSRYRCLLDDTDISRAAIIWEAFKQHPCSLEQRNFVECLLGRRDFLVSHFMHGEESSFQQYMINSVIVSTMSLSLCCMNETSGQPLPFLTRCLLKPSELKGLILPGFPDDLDVIHLKTGDAIKDESCFALCDCEKRLLFRKYKYKAVCVVCGREIQEDNLKVQRLFLNQVTSCFTNQHETTETKSSVRTLSKVSSNILQFLVRGCLLGSIALGSNEITEPEIKQLFCRSSSESKVSEQLLTGVHDNWNRTKDFLNMNDHDTGIFFHLLLQKCRQQLFEERSALVTSSQREDFETVFDNCVVQLLDSRFLSIHSAIRTCTDHYKLPNDCIELVIRETNNLENIPEPCRNEEMPSLFRMTTGPTKSDFLCQLWQHRQKYMFLFVTLEHENMLELPRHIYHIIRWHMTAVVHISYTLKRHDCLKKTAQEFYDSLSDSNSRKLCKEKFQKFKQSWNILQKVLESTSTFESLLRIDNNTKMADCLILDVSSDIYRVLTLLIDTQNKFIDTALYLSFRCKSLHFLQQHDDVACFKVAPVTGLMKNNLIDMSFDLEECIAQKSNGRLEYGFGKHVFYDFQSIEKELAINLLVNKAYINFDVLPQIVFMDELYRNFVSLLAGVRHSIPQEELPNDVENSLVKTSKDVANMSVELLNYIDMILTLVKKTKCDPQKSLTDFVRERSKILGKQFPIEFLPSPESRIKICHIIDLHELLEELSVDRIIGSLSDEYNVDLEDDLKVHFSKMPISNLRKSELVSKTLKKFIYRCVFMGDVDPEQPLLRFMSQESFWPLKLYCDGKLVIDGQEEEIIDIFPNDVLVRHAAAAVSLLMESIETQKQGELRMDRVITGWKRTQRPETKSKSSRQRKALKKLGKS